MTNLTDALGEEDAIFTIRVKVTHHPDELNTVQATTTTHLKTGPKANPDYVWSVIHKAVAHENAQFLKYHASFIASLKEPRP